MDLVTDASKNFLTKAVDRGAAAVEQASTLRGADARKAAEAALRAGGDPLRAEYALRMGDTTETMIAAGIAAAALLFDAVVLAAVAVKGTRRARTAAAVMFAGHATVAAVGWRRRRSLTQALDKALESRR